MKKSFLFLLALFCLPMLASASLDVNNSSYDPAPAQPGKQLTVWVNVTNNSNYSTDDVVVSVVEAYPFFVLPGEPKELVISKLASYATAQAKLKLLVDTAALEGTYNLSLKLSNSSEGSKTTSVSIKISGKNPKVELINSSLAVAKPGQEATAELKLKNIGGAKAKNIIVKIKEDRTVTATGVVVEREIIPLGASAALVNEIMPDEEAKVKMILGINKTAKLKNYSLPVTVEFYDENGTFFSSTGYIGINVEDSPLLDSVISSVSPVAAPGTTADLTVNVFNVGVASASYVVAEFSMDGASFSESKIFVGSLDPDDFDSIKTKIVFPANISPGNHELKVKLSYKNESNETNTIEKTLQLKVLTAEEAQAASNQTGNALFGIIGLLLELVGLFTIAKWLYPKIIKLSKK